MTDEPREAAARLAAWCAAPTDGADPYRDNAEHLFDADQFDADVKEVVGDYLAIRGRLLSALAGCRNDCERVKLERLLGDRN